MSSLDLVRKIKAGHPYFYGAVRDVARQVQQFQSRKVDNVSVIHGSEVSTSLPLDVININSMEKRLNIIFDRMTGAELEKPSITLAVIRSVDFANKYGYRLRIITRKHPAKPKVFCDFLKESGATLKNEYSFYTDSDERVAPKTRHLDLSEEDIFFATSANSLKAVQKTARTNIRFFCIGIKNTELPREALLVKEKTTIKVMRDWINDK